MAFEINNRLWIAKNGKPFLGIGRIQLLEQIAQEGSINKAAKGMGMSYKRAWEIVNTINEMAEEPVVVRQIGGSGGGGTTLTKKGEKLVSEFKRIDDKYRELLKQEARHCCF